MKRSEKSKKEADALISRIESDMKRVPEAIRHLRRVTGKMGTGNIDPLNEWRWSDKCRESWLLLNGIAIMLEEGITPETHCEKFMEGYKPMDSPFTGRHKTGKWRQSK